MIKLFHKGAMGVDLGNRSIKIVSLSRKKQQTVLENCLVQDLHLDNLEGLKVSQGESALTAMIETHGLQNKNIALQLQDSSVTMLSFQLPQIPPAEREAAILNEVEVKYGFTFENSCIDYQVTSSVGESAGRLEVRVFVTPKGSVVHAIAMLKRAHLKPVAFENNMGAIGACLDHNGYFRDAQCRLVIDIGETFTSLGYFQGSAMLGIQIVPLGACALYEPLATKLKVPLWRVQDLFETTEWTDEVELNFREALEAWSTLVSDKVYALKEQFANTTLSEGFLTGAGSRSCAFQKWLSNTTGTPISAVDPFRKIEVLDPRLLADEKVVFIAPYMSTAVGLALRDLA